jgi:hypothetical protein
MLDETPRQALLGMLFLGVPCTLGDTLVAPGLRTGRHGTTNHHLDPTPITKHPVRTMTEHDHPHGHKHGHHGHGEPQHQKTNKGLHKDWRSWLVVGLMLAAMLAYVLTMDESLQPGQPPGESMPADAAE